jgi:hypothetical protein
MAASAHCFFSDLGSFLDCFLEAFFCATFAIITSLRISYSY